MNKPDTANKGIKSAKTAFDILETIAERECTTVSTIADHLDYSKSTIYYYLNTMERNRYLIKEAGEYRLGLRVANLGAMAKDQYGLLTSVQERTDELAQELGVGADIVAEEAGKGVVLHRSRTGSDREIETHVGMEIDLHETAFGKVILAFLAQDRREEILSRYGPGEGANDPTPDGDELRQELEKIRQVGLAYDEDGLKDGTASIAAPIIHSSTEELYGALGIWGQPDELPDPTRYAKARRFAGDMPEEVEKVARIIGEKI